MVVSLCNGRNAFEELCAVRKPICPMSHAALAKAAKGYSDLPVYLPLSTAQRSIEMRQHHGQTTFSMVWMNPQAAFEPHPPGDSGQVRWRRYRQLALMGNGLIAPQLSRTHQRPEVLGGEKASGAGSDRLRPRANVEPKIGSR